MIRILREHRSPLNLSDSNMLYKCNTKTAVKNSWIQTVIRISTEIQQSVPFAIIDKIIYIQIYTGKNIAFLVQVIK